MSDHHAMVLKRKLSLKLITYNNKCETNQCAICIIQFQSSCCVTTCAVCTSCLWIDVDQKRLKHRHTRMKTFRGHWEHIVSVSSRPRLEELVMKMTAGRRSLATIKPKLLQLSLHAGNTEANKLPSEASFS